MYLCEFNPSKPNHTELRCTKANSNSRGKWFPNNSVAPFVACAKDANHFTPCGVITDHIEVEDLDKMEIVCIRTVVSKQE